MNIGLDAKRAFHNVTGLGNYSRLLIRSLQSHFPEHRYFLYTPRGGGAKDAEIRRPKAPLAKLFPSLWRSIGIPFDFSKVGLNIYHGLSNELPVGSQGRRVKNVVTIHDLIFLRYPQFYSPVDRRTYLWKTRHACRSADSVVAVSEQTKRDLVELLDVPESRVQVIYQGYDPVFDEPPPPDERGRTAGIYGLPARYLLSVGTIEERKNLVTVIDALDLMKHDAPPLVVVGKKRGYFRTVAEALRRKSRKPHVLFLENVPQRDLPSLYRGADLLLYPSLFEGFGIPILESLASGVPVVTSRGSCFAEAGGTGAAYIDPSSPEELAATVTRLLRDPELRGRMARQGREHLERFRLDRLARQMIQLYKSL